ncbi:MAG: TonB-dependent receptor, partial [Spongiibacteraceae bacterium]
SGQVVLNTDRVLEIVAQDRGGIPLNLDALLGLPLGTIPVNVTNQHINNNRFFDQHTESVAIFGQATWNVHEQLAFILGMRYSEETKDADAVLSYNSAFSAQFFNTFLSEVAFDETLSRKESDFSPKLSARYEVSDDITVYATWATAFKAGGFNEQAVDNTNLEFEPEEAVTWEAGAKMRFLDGAATLNAGLFYTDFDNLQVSLFNGTNFVVGNAASAISQGVELEGQLLPSHWLSLGGSIAYLDARYNEFVAGQCIATSGLDACDLSGRELTRAPEWEASFNPRVSISKLVAWVGELIPAQIGVGVDMTYRAHQYFSTDLDPIDQQNAYTEINGNIRIAGIDDDWSLLFSARNLSDKLVQAHGQDVPLQAGSHFGTYEGPRRYFVEFQYQW